MEKTREEILAEHIGNDINTYNFDNKKFNEKMSREHRTLQQQFTSICLAWIEHVGSSEYQYDGRNEYSHKQCKNIVQFMKENNIFSRMPMI